MTEIRRAAATDSPGTSRRRFIRHFLEMVVAMVLGMVVLAPVWDAAFAALGNSGSGTGSGLPDRPDFAALVMATNMAIGMSLWMRYRGHGWPAVWEMAAAMFAPYLILMVPFWTGLLSGEALHTGGHLLMLPCMLAAMGRRRAEYTQDHRHDREHGE